MTLIAFIGSVFSPYYAWQRRRWGDEQALAEEHVAVNVSLYRRAPGSARYAKWWTMTERGHRDLHRDRQSLAIGPSRLQWEGADRLRIDLDEWAAPWPQRVRGSLAVQLQTRPGRRFALDRGALHHWQPISPVARIDVALDAPAARWQGEAYLDCNWGRRPLARDFARWHWSRQRQADGCRVLYACEPRAGAAQALDLQIAADGAIAVRDAPPACALPASAWGVGRQTRALPAAAPTVAATLESGPFYCRSLLADADGGAPWMHESLDLVRFDRPLVQAMLPFRMPRHSS
ncbi:carotenoid 1,2-hydratase [Pseudorhodoferax sp. Leaf267]|uniref:carotenoid 1,2-hydratase n=1 Tax=Pseudorhodoferax sp. Leaf267 TaxID=1736316 RepID=UPI000B10B7D3|nr:carotenoid 1,2-hydratase [Pseudorhodoferax sp. Leaf267]